ncbi:MULTISPECIES: ribosome biogenesis GTP-binding protein YihA/YsxC [Flavobacterium]|mgnify:CR=1 FL=1|jgi:GTP-binding protein|uniref:Probable GTP-binding protein EngB n=1 Tax=Flavobacterium lindanitolerans TaxID=428988 RepID=A0A497V6L0_9FLAO|nr:MULTISPECIES: ribosome biogenesis GTP-binding protein YihA/YsxC [Flavobacterium]MBU7570559.1 YihA family ribosome biogenesis GTP-binding protein [Flavobacterium sp.]PZO29657.1 MAG: YihA family ribosome biogenesis GTP-binding protein [Flavobacteriaceae bacterium]THD31671.1 MAG: YihA family ribosome biogenesis GTP-binding protein [Flavobacterium johnsoniae]KQS50307.1 GTP-binding protein [Flavobacterium sp. Leaf359]MBL7867075.1 YihA family ribosome biogenesis GTP-binding protein [Flavobacteriu
MKINSAEFIISNSEVSKCPQERLPEYAFIGRSNVGKSSLINMLTNHKNLAKTSGRPGKTQLINHFKINSNWFLVDLPGYGYARVSKKTKEVFQKFITDYFEKREQLVCAFVLIDIRLEAQAIDLEFITYLGEIEVPFCIIFTKADKISKTKIDSHVAAYRKKLLASNWEEMPPYFITSSADGTGKEKLLTYIEEINTEVFKDLNNF